MSKIYKFINEKDHNEENIKKCQYFALEAIKILEKSNFCRIHSNKLYKAYKILG